jgi:integrase
LSWLTKKRDPQTVNYFEFAFFSGLRTSELVSLEWGDIDQRSGIARVQRARVLGNNKTTKTAKARSVELTQRALVALDRQCAYTHRAQDTVFQDPITSRPYVNDKPPRLQWNAALKALGIRHRTAYQTRHTFATLALMAGANPMWVARQLGHSTMQMTLTRYSRWIDKADQGRELAKLNDATGGEHCGE